MDGDDTDLSFLVPRVSQEVALLKADPRLAAPSGTRGAALRDHVLDLIGAVEQRISASPASNAGGLARKAYARSLRQAVVELQSAHRALPWLEATRTPHLNLGSLFLTEEYAGHLIGTNVDLVVVPDAEYMYSTTSWPFREYINGTPGFAPSNTRRPIVLNFPLTDADSVFLHPIFAHELGHSSVDEYDLTAAAVARVESEPAYHPERAAAVAAVKSAMPTWTDADVDQWLDERLDAWSTELLCDALALDVAGVPFLFALASFVLALSYGEPGQDHPPNTLRFNLALQQATARGWDPYLMAIAPGIRDWLGGVSAEALTYSQQPFSFLVNALLRSADAFHELAAARTGANAIVPSECAAHASTAAELLSHSILPVELDEPLDRRGILAGGWEAAIARHGDSPHGFVAATSDRTLQELVGKALESSVVLEAWGQL